jgi:hypothetical protein
MLKWIKNQFEVLAQTAEENQYHYLNKLRKIAMPLMI